MENIWLSLRYIAVNEKFEIPQWMKHCYNWIKVLAKSSIVNVKNRSLTILIYKEIIDKLLFSVIISSVVSTIRTINYVCEYNIGIILYETLA